jgi:hypothetical protein
MIYSEMNQKWPREYSFVSSAPTCSHLLPVPLIYTYGTRFDQEHTRTDSKKINHAGTGGCI